MDAMKTERVELNDIEMYYEMEGAGEPLLLLHGGTGCQEDWIYAGNILLHMATLQPERIEAMVVVSAAMYFPEQARAIMRQIPAADKQPAHEWERMRKSHKLGDEQITRLWDWMREMQDSYDDMNFTSSSLASVTASTLVVSGDRDPLYPVEMAVTMYRAIPRSALWVIPSSGHGPVFADAAAQFAQTALAFFRTPP
jgi:pimeloyl-ACP methyl ester carboxylesterase